MRTAPVTIRLARHARARVRCRLADAEGVPIAKIVERAVAAYAKSA